MRIAAKNILLLSLVAFLLTGTFGMSHVGMSIALDGQMSDCPFTPGVAICNMSPLEMIAASQSWFNALPIKNDVGLLFALLIAAAVFGVTAFWRTLSLPQVPLLRVPYPRREYFPLHHYLQDAFSNGILNPKLF